MNLTRLISAALILFCGFAAKAQTTKPVAKCNGECCKEDKQTKKSISLTKPVVSMETATKKKVIACKLTNPELQKRKEEVIASLKTKVLDRQELKEGYKYKLAGNDEIFDEVVIFIKTERQCCDFFIFDLSIADDNIWLSITGPDGAKEFIKMEMDL
jgi:hypothetical protein